MAAANCHVVGDGEPEVRLRFDELDLGKLGTDHLGGPVAGPFSTNQTVARLRVHAPGSKEHFRTRSRDLWRRSRCRSSGAHAVGSLGPRFRAFPKRVEPGIVPNPPLPGLRLRRRRACLGLLVAIVSLSAAAATTARVPRPRIGHSPTRIGRLRLRLSTPTTSEGPRPRRHTPTRRTGARFVVCLSTGRRLRRPAPKPAG